MVVHIVSLRRSRRNRTAPYYPHPLPPREAARLQAAADPRQRAPGPYAEHVRLLRAAFKAME